MGKEPPSPRAEFLIAMAGPLVSFILGAVCLSGAMAVDALPMRSTLQGLVVLGSLLGMVNVQLGLFNLIPGFPLDGRVLPGLLNKDSIERQVKIPRGIGPVWCWGDRRSLNGEPGPVPWGVGKNEWRLPSLSYYSLAPCQADGRQPRTSSVRHFTGHGPSRGDLRPD
jgi:hypothetical protein